MRSLVLTYLFVGACTAAPRAPTVPPGSRGMRADAHLSAAKEHDARVFELQHLPVSTMSPSGQFEAPVSALWTRHWSDSPQEHERLARMHRSKAAEEYAEYMDACAGIDSTATARSPIQRYGAGGQVVDGGVMVVLALDAGPPERLMAEIRCHRAWMMLADAGMDDCPFDLAGLHVQATGRAENIVLELTISDERLVGELRRRAAFDLEHASHEVGARRP